MPVAAPPTRGPLVLAGGAAAAVVAAVLLCGPLHALIARFGRDPEFPKVFRYLLLVLLSVALAATLRPWRDAPRDAWGLATRPGRNVSLVLAGAVAIALLLLAVASVHAVASLVSWDHGDGALKARQRALRFGLIAVPLALVEETFFRGWLVDRFARRWRAFGAALFGALVFAGLHAFRASRAPDVVVPGPSGALEILGAWSRQLGGLLSRPFLEGFAPSFLGLFAFGMALSAARLRFGTLAFGVGMHAAAFAFLPVYSALTDPKTEGRTWLGSKWLYDGVPGIALLSLLALALWPRAGTASRIPGAALEAGTSDPR